MQEATLEIESDGDSGFVFRFSGDLRADSVADIWRESLRKLERINAGTPIKVDVEKVKYCDGSGICLFVELELQQQKRGGTFELVGLDDKFKKLRGPFEDLSWVRSQPPGRKPEAFPVALGKETARLWHELISMIKFVGELTASTGWTLMNPGRIRWSEVLLMAKNVGANALPIVGLISFLIGLIVAFQAVRPLENFGAKEYVAELTAMSLVKELGPLITAILLAGRTGAAFAAEIGTMKINEEINALTTMGLQPIRFLVVTRVVATVLIMPILTMFSLVFGLIGGGAVYVSIGFSYLLYFSQITMAISLTDYLGGLLKATVFGLLVAAVGCFRGLQTQSGASAVGLSTTRAVVSGITLIVISDGVFSVTFHILGL